MLLAAKVEMLTDEQTMLDVGPVGVEDFIQPTSTALEPSSRSAPQPEYMLTQANHGDLDWSYTSRCIRRWSPNSLLTHLSSHAFSVPPIDPKPSVPFVIIDLVSQDGDDPESVSIPQAYRLPLLMVAKYLWETVLLALSAGQEEWMARATNIFHMSRLCENLFAGARVKTAKGGMETEWRCLMFDRFLTRFYNHWIQNDPASNESFWKKHGATEYDKDVLNHDWKEWSLRGLNDIRLTEQELSWGLSADQFRKTLILDRESHTWTLDGTPLSFITSDEGPAWSSVSELTDIDLDLEQDEDVKPSLDVINSFSASVQKEPTRPSGAGKGDSGSPTKRLRFAHRSPSVRLLSRVPDQPRLSTRRKSSGNPSALVPSPFVANSNSAMCQTTSSPEKHVRPSSRNKQPRLVVLIKPRAQILRKSSEQSSIRNVDRPNVAPSVIDLTQPAATSNLSKRVSSPSPRRKEMESDGARAKRRRIDEFDFGKRKDDNPVQASTHQALCSAAHEPNGVSSNVRVEASTQTTPMAIAIQQGTHVDQGVVACGSTHMPTVTVAKKATSDVAIQVEMNSVRDDNSLKAHQMRGVVDGCTVEMQNNLSLVVDNLVSSRMLSLMRGLKRSNEPGLASGSGPDGSSPIMCGGSALPSTMGSPHLVNGLFDEVRLLREEAHSREQRTREEMRALRHLHNAEVDSLRRRLAYLEYQSHEQVVRECDTRGAAGEGSNRGGQTHYNSGGNMPPKFGDKHYHLPEDDIPSPSFDVVRSARSSNGNLFSGRFISAKRNGNDMEEESPLPSKAQRKSRIIPFSRPSATG